MKYRCNHQVQYVDYRIALINYIHLILLLCVCFLYEMEYTCIYLIFAYYNKQVIVSTYMQFYFVNQHFAVFHFRWSDHKEAKFS